MKKVLFATTALVATAGIAAADGHAGVDFSGYARWGLLYNEDAATETRIESRFRLNIDPRIELDNGLVLSARVRMQADDNANGSAGEAGLNGARFRAQAAGFRVEVGNIGGAIEDGGVVNYYGSAGGIGQIEYYNTWGAPVTTYSSTGAGVNGLSVQYSAGGFTIAAAYHDDHDGVGGTYAEGFDVGVGYEFGNYAVGAAYGEKDDGVFGGVDTEFWLVTGEADFGPASVGIMVGEDDVVDEVAYGMWVTYDVGANTTLIANFAAGGTADNNTVGDGDDEAYSVGVRHNIAPGVSFRGAVGQNTSGTTVGDFGIRFDF